MSVDGDVETV